MNPLQGAKTPLSLVGWPLLVAPVLYGVFDGLHAQFADDLPYFNFADLACAVVGVALVALGGSRFAAALAGAIGTGLLAVTGLVSVIEVAIRANQEYLGTMWYVNGVLLVLVGGTVTAGLSLLAVRWRSPGLPGYSPYPGYPQQQQYPGHPQQQPGFPPQGAPQQPGYPQPPQGQPYGQPGYPQQPPYGQQQPPQ